MYSVTGGSQNTLVGNHCGYNITTGGSNTCVCRYAAGDAAGSGTNCTGNNNVLVGLNAGTQLTTGSNNTAIGTYALDADTTASNNTALGYSAMSDSTTASGCVAVGTNAALDLTTGSYNVTVGSGSGSNMTTASYNTFVGEYAGYGNDSTANTGGYNTLIGARAAQSITSGTNNTCVGYEAGKGIANGATNVCIGYQAGGTGMIAAGDNQLYIARDNVGPGNDACWIYGDDTGSCNQGDNSSSWSTTSDRRLKKNIVDSSKGLVEINQIRVANFEYRLKDEIDMSEFPLADDSKQVVIGEGKEGQVQTGVIAQEVEAVIPECIKVSAAGAKTVNTDPIMWAMVNAIKELSTKNDELAAEIASLKSQINN